jgi:hypothetical protein
MFSMLEAVQYRVIFNYFQCKKKMHVLTLRVDLVNQSENRVYEIIYGSIIGETTE